MQKVVSEAVAVGAAVVVSEVVAAGVPDHTHARAALRIQDQAVRQHRLVVRPVRHPAQVLEVIVLIQVRIIQGRMVFHAKVRAWLYQMEPGQIRIM